MPTDYNYNESDIAAAAAAAGCSDVVAGAAASATNASATEAAAAATMVGSVAADAYFCSKGTIEKLGNSVFDSLSWSCRCFAFTSAVVAAARCHCLSLLAAACHCFPRFAAADRCWHCSTCSFLSHIGRCFVLSCLQLRFLALKRSLPGVPRSLLR